MAYVLMVFAGALLVNAIPHLAAGLRGEPFPTPFAKPRGIGLSGPRTNMLWGSANLSLGLFLAHHFGQAANTTGAMVAAAAGWLALGWYLAGHFGAVRSGR